MLCDFSRSFPKLAAKILDRDQSLTRNFREETITDLLMAGLVGFRSMGIRVDFPDEVTTGGDMEWHFAAPKKGSMGRYIGLIIQAKRAHSVKRKKSKYWQYRHLDHDKGLQAQKLMQHAKKNPGVVPLYIFYHPLAAVTSFSGSRPAVEGANIVFAGLVAPRVVGGCSGKMKRLEKWRPHFLSLSDFLCHPQSGTKKFPVNPKQMAYFFDGLELFPVMSGIHPDIIAGVLQEHKRQAQRVHESEVGRIRESGKRRELTSDEKRELEGNVSLPDIKVLDEIPAHIWRAISDEPSKHDMEKLERPRVIFTVNE